MATNRDKPERWASDIAQSVDLYNRWFMTFAPQAFHDTRAQVAEVVAATLRVTHDLRDLQPETLRQNPQILSTLRMCTCPPLARDRLIGLASVPKSLVERLEKGQLPTRLSEVQLSEELGKITTLIARLIDHNIFSWLETNEQPTEAESYRAVTIIADRLCGASTDPIIRNAQENRQLQEIAAWLDLRSYRQLPTNQRVPFNQMSPGTYSFRLNVPVNLTTEGGKTINIPVDAVIMRSSAQPGDLPVLVEAKSAGDFTNVNKRKKEEAQKMRQLRATYGDRIEFVLFLCGYFDTSYLSYEATEVSIGFGSTGLMILQTSDYKQIDLAEIERRRVLKQKELDAAKSIAERNRLGQFATPNALAIAILNYSKSLLSPTERIRFLDPAIGTGSFFSALLQCFPNEQIERAIGYEIDLDVAAIAAQLWNSTALTVEHSDFTKIPAPASERLKSNFLVCNPPYVRHHHLSIQEKQFLRNLAIDRSGIQLSGLAGLYCYFLLAAHEWMSDGGLACWLIPSEFMDVNYGKQIKAYLLNSVTLLRIHRFEPEDLQFGDALVSSSVIWFRNTRPQQDYAVELTCGSIEQPSLTKMISTKTLRTSTKWTTVAFSQEHHTIPCTKLSDLFEIKRGVATGANQFFILTPEQINTFNLPQEFLTPILPSSRYLPDDEILADEQGNPILDRRLFLLTCTQPPEELQRTSPAVWDYLQRGVEAGIPEGYLCRHRSLWYQQEHRQPAPFLCTYMGRSGAKRGNPFRFILNHSDAIAPNVYLMMYPKAQLASWLTNQPALLHPIWNALKSISAQSLIHEGRVYGDGLHKLEPKELGNAPAEAVLAVISLAAKIP